MLGTVHLVTSCAFARFWVGDAKARTARVRVTKADASIATREGRRERLKKEGRTDEAKKKGVRSPNYYSQVRVAHIRVVMRINFRLSENRPDLIFRDERDMSKSIHGPHIKGRFSGVSM